jgi:hypothetical protein
MRRDETVNIGYLQARDATDRSETMTADSISC